jgi:anti-sigma B factor antagonist
MITQTSTRQIAPDITVIEITGRLCFGSTLFAMENSIKDLISSGVRKLAIDIAGLLAIDSAGLGTLLASSGEMSRVGGRFRVAGAVGHVAQSFALVRLDAIVKLDPDLQTSLYKLALPISD